MKKIISLIVILVVLLGGAYYFFLGNKYPEMTEEVIQTVGGQEMADKLIANFENSRDKLNEAIIKYEENGMLDEDKPDIVLFVDYARDAKYIRKYDLAIKVLEGVFDYYEKSDIALINLAKVYEDMGEYQKAIDAYLKFYDMFGVQIQQFHLDIMNDYMALGDKANVIKYYEEFRKEGYDSEEIRQYVTTPSQQ